MHIVKLKKKKKKSKDWDHQGGLINTHEQTNGYWGSVIVTNSPATEVNTKLAVKISLDRYELWIYEFRATTNIFMHNNLQVTWGFQELYLERTKGFGKK